jgi:chemotaxis protein MotB
VRRRKHEEEHENHERWLVSYADFITLLFAFFVVMYSVSRVDNKRLTQVASAIKWALSFSGTGGVAQMPIFEAAPSEGGNPVDMGSSGPIQTPRVAPEVVREQLERRLQGFLRRRTGPQAVTVVLEGKVVTVRLAAGEFFDPGQAALRPDVLPILDAIAEELVPLGKPLRVEGHTDGTPVLGGRYQDNWELSAARAATVVSYVQRAHGVPPAMLAAIGFGSSRPLAAGSSPGALETNRRVEIVAELGPFEERVRLRGAASAP